MCLEKIEKKALPKSDNGIGYKVFERWSKSSKLQTVFVGKIVYTHKWNKAMKILLKSNAGLRYKSGFHIYKTRENQGIQDWLSSCYQSHAELWKVEYRNVVAHGTENGVKVIVVKEMKLLEKII